MKLPDFIRSIVVKLERSTAKRTPARGQRITGMFKRIRAGRARGLRESRFWLPYPRSQEHSAQSQNVQTFAFDRADGLKGWTVTGDVTIDAAHGRQGSRGSLRVGPGGKAFLKLRDGDASGKVEFWVHDDGTRPENPKASRLGPRWGLVQNDGRVLAVGILYASYLGGDEGYTATACDGTDTNWFDQLFWLGVNRAPAGWHKWTFDFDAEAGLEIFHNDRELTAVDAGKTGLRGFSAIAVWGDQGQGHEQIGLGGRPLGHAGGPGEARRPPARPTPTRRARRHQPQAGRVVIYTRDNAPAAPPLKDLPLVEVVSQYGITWTFDKPARVGHFINGDWYVVGPVTIKAIDPKPLYGGEIARRELDQWTRSTRRTSASATASCSIRPPG